MSGAPGAVRPDVEAVLARLKGFQRTTVEYAFERLYRAPDSTRRFLVADEVGLGKTLVARGVIAKAIDHLWETIDRIDIVYICSNGQIARQNVNRLRISEGGKFVPASRLTLLPVTIGGLRKNKVNYLAFTPGTSLDLKKGMGRKDERIVLYRMLQAIWPDPRTGPKNLLQGWVVNSQEFRRELDHSARTKPIDSALQEAFSLRLRQAGRSREEGGEGLEAEYERLCHQFSYFREEMPKTDRDAQTRLIGRFRELLAETCIDALEPDLVILDEFQRFKDILDGEEGAALLAKRLFTYSDGISDVRLLLLSATPYKMYTLKHEEDEEDHYQDFLRTVEFLDQELKATGSFREDLAGYRREMFRVEEGTGGLIAAKERIERELRRVMCRTERLRAAGDGRGMLSEGEDGPITLRAGDVTSFVALARIGEMVGQPQVLEYWKSAPYLLNFMDGYKLKREVVAGLDAATGKDGLGELLDLGEEALLPWPEVESYGELDLANPLLRSLLAWVDRHELWKLLWLPPSLSYYETSSPPAASVPVSLSKRLVFSTWTVVPKTIACLASYHVERLVYRADEDEPQNTPDEQRRRQRPLLRLTQSRERLVGMPVLALLYPSFALARICDPLEESRALTAAGAPRTLERMLQSIDARLAGPVERIIENYAAAESERVDEAWYWAAPLLLDLASDSQVARRWLLAAGRARRWAGGEDDDEGEESRWADHVEQAAALVRGEIELGPPPEDLIRVLSLQALAAPAVCALRSLTNVQGGRPDPLRADARDAAAQIAWSFRTLFNLAEAKAIVRMGDRGLETPYWRQVLEYSADGQLQAVLDEYVHVLRDLEGLFDLPPYQVFSGLAQAIRSALSLRTAAPSVDELRRGSAGSTTSVHRRRMRNHFAMRFGAQETDDGQAGAREDQVRTAFNSPFWPFVLASTSVGQEGLDFHAYCHAVVHWNLPSNPVDLEQREGRVHRYKGHAVRKNVARAFGEEALASWSGGDVWAQLFELARERRGSDHGLVPYWIFSDPEGAFIERHVPMLPMSREVRQLEALKRSLAVYRMVFGQPHQDDLMAYLLDRMTEEQLRELEPLLRIDLAPRARG